MPLSVAREDAHDAFPAEASGAAVLVLAGSSGRIESERADLFARHGVRARAIRWFGGRGQRPTPHEVPIELFADQIDELRHDHDRVAVLGTSFGAEAALVTAATVALDVTIAIAPSAVVWSGVADGDWSSHWTVDGMPLPSVAFDPAWSPETDPPEYLSLYETSLSLDSDRTARATIAAERITGHVLLVAGGDDRVWPSAPSAAAIAERRRMHDLDTTVLVHPDAGHRIVLPGEDRVSGGTRMVRGGTPAADAELGTRTWAEITRLLPLAPAAG